MSMSWHCFVIGVPHGVWVRTYRRALISSACVVVICDVIREHDLVGIVRANRLYLLRKKIFTHRRLNVRHAHYTKQQCKNRSGQCELPVCICFTLCIRVCRMNAYTIGPIYSTEVTGRLWHVWLFNVIFLNFNTLNLRVCSRPPAFNRGDHTCVQKIPLSFHFHSCVTASCRCLAGVIIEVGK